MEVAVTPPETTEVQNADGTTSVQNVDGTGGVVYKYKFAKGLCPESHGRHVAKIAGLPQKAVDE